MSTPDLRTLAVLQAAADEVRAAGAVPHTDHLVEGVMPQRGSSEIVGLRVSDDGTFEIYYRDLGETSVLLRTPDPDQARQRFADEVFDLIGGRGYGPRAGAGS